VKRFARGTDQDRLKLCLLGPTRAAAHPPTPRRPDQKSLQAEATTYRDPGNVDCPGFFFVALFVRYVRSAGVCVAAATVALIHKKRGYLGVGFSFEVVLLIADFISDFHIKATRQRAEGPAAFPEQEVRNNHRRPTPTRQFRSGTLDAARSDRWRSASSRPEPKGFLNMKLSYERYLELARAEAQNGNAVAAENYYQHAEHYFRSMYSGSSES
jgi:Domain of unknown function (DUF4167)